MTEPKMPTWRFANRYGEEWEFTYDVASKQGILRGSDVDWQAYLVVEGKASGLVLNEEEIHWLRRVWTEATIEV